jgi:hypothetical protein
MPEAIELPTFQPEDGPSFDEPRITIEMGGANIVIRANSHVDHGYTTTLAEAINAATEADTSVVVDPAPIRCDDKFAAYVDGSPTTPCSVHPSCRAVAAEVVAAGVVRLRTERRSWLIDVSNGRMCHLDGHINLRFLSDQAWTRVVAVCVTPSRLIALMPNGRLLSARRAHAAAA